MFKFSKIILLVILIFTISFSGFWLWKENVVQAGKATAPTLTQNHFRWRNDNGTEITATWRQSEDVDDSRGKNLNIRLRIGWAETAGAADTSNTDIIPLLEYKLAASATCSDSTGWTSLTTGSTEFQLVDSTYYLEPIDTTQQLTGGTPAWLAGQLLDQTNPATMVTMSKKESEHEWNFIPTDSASEAAYIFRVSRNGTGFNNYYNCPTLTVTGAASISCTTPLTQTSFGTIDNTAVYTSSPDASTTVTTDNDTGFIMTVYNAGDSANPGLYKAPATSDVIGSANATYGDTATLVAGVEGYGIQATTSSSNITIDSRFWYSSSTDDVGGLEVGSGNAVSIASSSGAVTNQLIFITHKATAAVLNQAGDYSDTITYTCTMNP